MYIPIEHRNEVRSNNTVFAFVRYNYFHIIKIQQQRCRRFNQCTYCYLDKHHATCGDLRRESFSCNHTFYIGKKKFTAANTFRLIRRYKLK